MEGNLQSEKLYWSFSIWITLNGTQSAGAVQTLSTTWWFFFDAPKALHVRLEVVVLYSLSDSPVDPRQAFLNEILYMLHHYCSYGLLTISFVFSYWKCYPFNRHSKDKNSIWTDWSYFLDLWPTSCTCLFFWDLSSTCFIKLSLVICHCITAVTMISFVTFQKLFLLNLKKKLQIMMELHRYFSRN